MAASTYGAYNPQSHDPYPIETSLVSMLGDPNKSGMALPWLNAYGAQRQLSSLRASEELAGQHDFAERDMQAGIEADLRKNFVDVGQVPGLMPVAASNPNFGGVFKGTNLPAMQQFANTQQRKQDAGIFQDSMSGAHSAANAGYKSELTSLSRMAGMPLTEQTPLSLQAAQINASSGGGGGANEGSMASEYYDPNTGAKITINQTARGHPGGASQADRLKQRTVDAQEQLAEKTSDGRAIATGQLAQQNHNQAAKQVADLGASSDPRARAVYKAINDAKRGAAQYKTTREGRLVGVVDGKLVVF